MKKMKKVVSLLLAMVMVLSMSVSVFAEDADYTITAPDNGHTYEVYQIFTGDLSEGVLSNVKWGKNGTGNAGEAVEESILTELSNTSSKSDSEKIEVIKKYVNLTSNTAYGTVTSTQPLSNVPAGYYLIKDMDRVLEGKDDAYTTYIVKVVDNVTIAPKSAKPTVDKQVLDETGDAEAGSVDGWGETADHAINESFQFKLIATLPAAPDFAAYNEYMVKFTDTMSAGITFEKIDSVKVNDTPIDGSTSIDGSGYSSTATAGMTGGTWTLTISNLKEYIDDLTSGVTVEVIYTAHLNENAVIGNEDDNKNTVYLEYSNNPNGEGTGKTAPDTVYVFTYELDNTKVDGSNNDTPLGGAGFRLYNDETCNNEIYLIYDEALNAYRPIKNGETGEEMKSAATTGVFNIKGLDAGTYYLKETTTPDGYNTCPVVKIEISAEHSENNTGASTDITLKKDGIDFNGINTIQNNKGSLLPSTGGIGTTIFYVVGTILVIGAAVLLVAKKRMSTSEK